MLREKDSVSDHQHTVVPKQRTSRYLRNALIGGLGIGGAAMVGGYVDNHFMVYLPREADIKAAYSEVKTTITPQSSEEIEDAKALLDIKRQCDSGAIPIIVWRNKDLLGSCNITAHQVQTARDVMDQQARFDKEFVRARDRHFADSSKKTGIVYENRATFDGVVSIGGFLAMIASAASIGLMSHKSQKHPHSR